MVYIPLSLCVLSWLYNNAMFVTNHRSYLSFLQNDISKTEGLETSVVTASVTADGDDDGDTKPDVETEPRRGSATQRTVNNMYLAVHEPEGRGSERRGSTPDDLLGEPGCTPYR